MAYLLDTNVLVRLANAADLRYAIADRAVMELHRRGEVLHAAPQVLIEHAVTHILNFNAAHFARMAGIAPGIVVVDPASV